MNHYSLNLVKLKLDGCQLLLLKQRNRIIAAFCSEITSGLTRTSAVNTFKYRFTHAVLGKVKTEYEINIRHQL